MKTSRILCFVTVLFGLAAFSFAALSTNWTVQAPQGVNSYTVTNKALTTNVATLTIGAHSLVVGDSIAVALSPEDPRFDGVPVGATFALTAVTATTVSYARVNPNVAGAGCGGTVIGPLYMPTGGQGRGMAYNAATNHVYLTSYANSVPMIAILSANTGAYLGQLKNRADVTTKTLSSNVATLTTSAPHGLLVGQYAIVALSPADAAFDGTYVITGVTASTISYAMVSTNVAPTATGGTINNIAGKGFLMPIKVAVCNGAIYSTPMTLNARGTNAAQDYPWIFRWASETAAPHPIYANTMVDAPNLTANGPIGPKFPANVVTAKSRTGNVATIYFGGPHGTSVGVNGINNQITVTTPDASFNGQFTVTSVSDGPTVWSVSYTNNGADVAQTAETGTVGVNGHRLGETLEVVADSGAPGANIEIYEIEAVQTTCAPAKSVYKFTYVDGAGAVTGVQEIVLQNCPTGSYGAYNGGVSVTGFGGQIYRSASVETARYENNGTGRNALTGGLGVHQPNGGLRYGVMGGIKMIGAACDNYYSTHPNRNYVRGHIFQLDAAGQVSRMRMLDVAPSKPAPSFANGNATGDTAFDVAGSRAFIFTSNNILMSVTPPTVGGTNNFTNAVDQAWANAGNWSLGHVPNGLEDAVIKTGSTCLIGGYNSAVVKTLTIEAGATAEITAKNQPMGYLLLLPAASGFGDKRDITITGAFTGVTNGNSYEQPSFKILFTGTGTTFSWNNDNSATYASSYKRAGATNVAITAGIPQTLADGFSVTFGSASYRVGDYFNFRPWGNDETIFVAGDGVDGEASPDVKIYGTLKNAANAVAPTSGIVLNNLYPGNAFKVYNGGEYHHITVASFATPFANGQTVPTPDGATFWEPSSSFVYDQMLTAGTSITFSGRKYGNLILRNSYKGFATTVTSVYNASGSTYSTIQGNLVCEAGANFNPAMTGGFEIDGNIVSNGSSATTLLPLELFVDTTVAGGLTFGGSTTVSGTSPVRIRAGTIPATKSVTLARDLLVNLSTANAATALTVNGLLDTAGYMLQTSLTNVFNLTVASTGEVRSKAAAGLDGIAGSLAQFGTVTFNGNLTLNGTSGQVTGTKVPGTIGGLKVDNPTTAGLTGSLVVSTLELANGRVLPGANTLTAGDGATAVSSTGGYVDGALSRSIAASGAARSLLFPVGAGANYAPAAVDIASTPTAGILTVATANGDAPGFPLPANAIDRSWSLAASGGFAPGATNGLQLTYTNGDLGSLTETNLAAWRDTGSGWEPKSTLVNAGTNTATVSGVSAFSVWTLADTPDINVPVVSHDFGLKVVGSGPYSQNFAVQNLGTATLNLTVVKLPGGSAELTLDASPTTVAPSGSQNVTVGYAATTAGSQSATFRITSDDPDEPTVDITVAATGLTSSYAVVGDNPALGSWTPALAPSMNDLGNNGDAAAGDSIYTAQVDLNTTPTTGGWKVLLDKAAGWPGGSVGRQADAGNMPDAPTSGTFKFYYDIRDLTAQNWLPATQGLGSTIYTAYKWVLVGGLQSEFGGSDWDPDSTVTEMKDDGLNGDTSAGDGIFTYEGTVSGGIDAQEYLIISDKTPGWGPDGVEIKFGTNGMAVVPGGVTQPTLTLGNGGKVKFEFDVLHGHMRTTITLPSAIGDWSLYSE